MKNNTLDFTKKSKLPIINEYFPDLDISLIKNLEIKEQILYFQYEENWELINYCCPLERYSDYLNKVLWANFTETEVAELISWEKQIWINPKVEDLIDNAKKVVLKVVK